MTILGIDRETLERLGGGWSDDGLWDDIMWLAVQTWSAEGEGELAVRWHHLVMAVGNFKRQSGRRLFPQAMSPVSNVRFSPRAGSFVVPGSGHVLLEDDDGDGAALESWEQLKLRGAGVPTTTALLSALWPESHLILDWRVLAAASALTLGTDNDLGIVKKNAKQPVNPKLAHYPAVRGLLVDVSTGSGLALTTVERALYVLASMVRAQADRTWLGYRDAIMRAATRAPKAGTGDDGATDPDGRRPTAP